MKIFIATDIHGSAHYAEKIAEAFKKSNADQFILLGDVYNHGPRNPFPANYAPLKVAETFNALADRIVAVKGNCDSEVDQTISEFPFVAQHIICVNNRRFYFTHGHVYNKSNLPSTAQSGDLVFYGHFHINEITQNNGVICVNVGSASLPKDGKRAYCIADERSVTLYTLDGETVDKFAF